MSKLNILVHLGVYSDSNASNATSLNNFKWTRDVNGLSVSNPISEAHDLAPSESKNIFSGQRVLSSDNTTEWDITLKNLSTFAYELKASAGTMPEFRDYRDIQTDATSQVTVTINGPLAIFTFSGGTLPDLSSVVVGDEVLVGDQFNSQLQGKYKILSKSSDSITVENRIAVAEGPITLGSTFADQFRIYSSAGVQVGDTLIIGSGFSSVTQGSYKVVAVTDNTIEFYSTSVLPEEQGILSTSINVYSSAKELIYIESDKKVTVTINGNINSTIEPFVINNSIKPGIFLLKSTVYSLSVSNAESDTANILVLTAE